MKVFHQDPEMQWHKENTEKTGIISNSYWEGLGVLLTTIFMKYPHDVVTEGTRTV